jgi:hypothetical protein
LPKGRPIKAITDTMALIEDSEAVMMRLGRYAEYNYIQQGRSMDKEAIRLLDDTLARWRRFRAEKFQQGLLFEEEDGKAKMD